MPVAPIGVRMPDSLRDRIKVAAASNHRSMNSEIVFQLERAYAQKGAAGAEFGDQTPAATINLGNGAS